MEENNSNEEFQKMIKKIKAARKRNFLIKLGCVCFVYVLIFIYFCLPVSHAKNTSVKGTHYYSKNQILEIANVSKKSSLYFLDNKKIEESLNKSPLLGGNCKVSISPFGMKITVEEKYPAYYVDKDGVKTYYFSDGQKINDALLNSEDENIGTFLKEHLALTYQTKFAPSEISKKELNNINVILDSIDQEVKDRIIFINYSAESEKYSVYLKCSNTQDALKIVFECKSNVYLEGVPKAFSKDQLNKLESLNCDTNKSSEDGMNVYTHEIIDVKEDTKGLYYITFKKIN